MQTAFVKKKLVINITANRGKSREEPRVDFSIYPRINKWAPVSEFDLTEGEKDDSKSTVHVDCLEDSAKMSWQDVIVPVEVKSRSMTAAFTPAKGKDKGTTASMSIGGEKVRGQMTEYVSYIQYHQHRNFVFSIYIHATDVYLIRWDRVGAVVCDPFDLQDDDQKLHRFLFRLENMTLAQLGYDPTVRLAEDSAVKKFQDFVPQNDYLKAYQKEALDKDWKRYEVDVPALTSPHRLRLVIGKPRFGSRSAVGRGTKGLVAFDLDNNRLVFLKDYWRSRSNESRAELEVYEKLHKAKVQNIATPIGGGDVDPDNQRTITEKYITGGSPDSRVHYRFAVRQVGRPLETYSTAREMVGFIHDAVIGT